jgi:hypothetical protein
MVRLESLGGLKKIQLCSPFGDRSRSSSDNISSSSASTLYHFNIFLVPLLLFGLFLPLFLCRFLHSYPPPTYASLTSPSPTSPPNPTLVFVIPVYSSTAFCLYFLFPCLLIKIMFLGSKVRLVRGADNLTAIYEPIV